MISTEQGAWWETLLGTEPSRKRLAPRHALVADHDQIRAALLGDVEDRVGGVALASVDVDVDARLARRRGGGLQRARRRPRAG